MLDLCAKPDELRVGVALGKRIDVGDADRFLGYLLRRPIRDPRGPAAPGGRPMTLHGGLSLDVLALSAEAPEGRPKLHFQPHPRQQQASCSALTPAPLRPHRIKEPSHGT